MRFLTCHDSGLGFPKTSQQLPKVSDDLSKTSERCRKCLKNVPMIFTHLQSYFKRVNKFNIKNLDLFFAEIELNFRYESCVKEQFVWICESGARN